VLVEPGTEAEQKRRAAEGEDGSGLLAEPAALDREGDEEGEPHQHCEAADEREQPSSEQLLEVVLGQRLGPRHGLDRWSAPNTRGPRPRDLGRRPRSGNVHPCLDALQPVVQAPRLVFELGKTLFDGRAHLNLLRSAFIAYLLYTIFEISVKSELPSSRA